MTELFPESGLAEAFFVEYLGDITDYNDGMVFATYDEALADVAARFGPESEAKAENGRSTPDPEDDRIIIWRCVVGRPKQAVWHFSGWHWSWDAAELSGGPLPQGALPGDKEDLYSMAMSDD